MDTFSFWELLQDSPTAIAIIATVVILIRELHSARTEFITIITNHIAHSDMVRQQHTDAMLALRDAIQEMKRTCVDRGVQIDDIKHSVKRHVEGER